jgi:hypothetical protein
MICGVQRQREQQAGSSGRVTKLTVDFPLTYLAYGS